MYITMCTKQTRYWNRYIYTSLTSTFNFCNLKTDWRIEIKCISIVYIFIHKNNSNIYKKWKAQITLINYNHTVKRLCLLLWHCILFMDNHSPPKTSTESFTSQQKWSTTAALITSQVFMLERDRKTSELQRERLFVNPLMVWKIMSYRCTHHHQ